MSFVKKLRLIPYSARIDFRRQNLTSVDPRSRTVKIEIFLWL